MKRKVDLSKGNVWTILLAFCVPIYLGLMFQNLYNAVDSIVVGQFVGSNELAAVAACSNIAMLVTGFFLGMATGASVLFSRFYGAKDSKRFKDAMQTTILFTIILGVAVTLIGIVFAPQILRFLSCPEEVFEGALIYLRIYMAGLLFIAFYNTTSAILRAIGDSQSPFRYLVIASIIHIGLDVLFVTVFHFGIAGVAFATVCSQGLSSFLCFKKLMEQEEEYRLSWKGMHIDWELLKQVIELGIPAGLQSCVMSISNVFVQKYINGFGAASIAGIGSAMRIDQFAGMSSQALGLGISNFVAQNIGAEKGKRVFKGIRITVFYTLLITGLTSIPVFIFAPQLMRIFTKDEAVIVAGVGMLRTIMPFYEFMGLNGCCSGIIRGFGKSTSVMVINIIGMVVLRQIYLAIALQVIPSIDTIYACYPLGWICVVLPMVVFYFLTIHKQFNYLKYQEEN